MSPLRELKGIMFLDGKRARISSLWVSGYETFSKTVGVLFFF